MKPIGTHYHEAEANHVTTVDYYGGGIDVLENEWDDGQFMVTQEMPDVRHVSDAHELRRMFHEAMTAMAALESLGYDLDYCDDGVAFWSKDISQ